MNDYRIGVNFFELDLLQKMVEVTIERQLNFIASQTKLINQADDKIKELQLKISQGKGHFLFNPQADIEKVIIQKGKLISPIDVAKRELINSRAIYKKILDERERNDPGSREIYIKQRLFEDRINALNIPGFEKYHYTEIGSGN